MKNKIKDMIKKIDFIGCLIYLPAIFFYLFLIRLYKLNLLFESTEVNILGLNVKASYFLFIVFMLFITGYCIDHITLNNRLNKLGDKIEDLEKGI